jgi:hypothetical protein
MIFTRFLLTTVYVCDQARKFGSQSQYVQICIDWRLEITCILLRHHTNGYFILLVIEPSLADLCAGRILSRLSKDQDTLDNELSMTLYQVGDISVLSPTLSKFL